MELERNILQREVFPNLTKYCNNRGWQFEDVDLRWGINDEASLDQRTMQICLEELRACQTMSPRPNFLILQGDRYGWIPLPEVLTKVQGDKIRASANEDELVLFDRWYKLDTNHNVSGGGNWILQPRSDEFADWNHFKIFVETPLRELFEREGEEWMNQSATEQEIWAGAFSQPDAREHVVLYDRHLKHVPREKKCQYEEKWSCAPNSGYQRVRKLRKHEHRQIEHKLCKSISFASRDSSAYTKWFAEEIEALLRDVIETEINRYEAIPEEDVERLRAEEFIAHSHKALFGREEELKELFEYSRGSVIYLEGPSGSGLSTLSAAFINDKNSVFCSVGITHFSGNGTDMLRTVWNRLNGAKQETPFSFRSLSNLLKTYEGDPIWIVIDGIYHLNENDEIRREVWHPNTLSENVTLIITCAFKIWVTKAYTLEALIVSPKSFSVEEAEHFLSERLKQSDADITSRQYRFVERILRSREEMNPKYLNLLFADIATWHSYDESQLPLFYADSRRFMEHIARRNGPQLCQKSLNLLSSSQFGVSVQELRSFLMEDAEFKEEFYHSSHHNLDGELAPSILCTRLLKDLAPHLNNAAVFDTFLSRITNPVFLDIIRNHLKASYSITGGTCFTESVFNFYDKRWRAGDIHALYEIGHIANHVDNKERATQLFSDLDYCIAKLTNHCSTQLRPQMTLFLKRNEVINDFVQFDIDAESYKKEHGELDERETVCRLAGAWRPGSTIREAYDRLQRQDTLLNTLGWRSYSKNVFISVSGEPDNTAFPTDDGLVFWIQDELLMCADINTGEVKEVRDHIRLFQHIGNGECIIYDGTHFALLKDNLSHYIGFYPSGRYSGIEKFFSMRDSQGVYHVVFVVDGILYWLSASGEENRPVFDLIEQKMPLDTRWKWGIGGFLFDGNSIVMQALVYDGEVQKKVQVMKVDRINGKLSFDYNGSFVSVADCQHKEYQPYLSLFPAITTDGKNHVSTIHFKYDRDGAYCVTYLATYNEGGMKLRDLDLSACSLRRGWTYYLHISTDGETLLHCSLDTRLVKYNLRANTIDSVLHLPSEGIGPHASPDNSYVLFDNREYRREYGKQYFPLYNRLLSYKNLSTADDYFDSGLTTISADSKASIIVTSFGNYYGVCAESATAYILSGNSVIRQSLPKEEIWSYSTAVAVSHNGKNYAYALGAGDFDSPEHWQYVIRDNEGRVCQTHGNITMMQYASDGRLFALLSHLSPTVCHQFLTITNGGVQRIDLHRMDTKDSALSRGKYVSFKLSPDGKHVLYCSDKYGRYSLGLLDLASKKAWEIAGNVQNYWWLPDSRSACFTLSSAESTVVYDLASGQTTVIHNVAVALNPIGCQFVYKIGEDGLRQDTKEIHLGAPIENVLFCQDGYHCFVVTENAVFLINWNIASIVQRFYLAYPDDISRKCFSGFWVAGGSSKNKPKRLWHHIQLYDKGLLMSDWDTLFRLEPEKGYQINEEVLTTIGKGGTYRCPLCGQVHKADIELTKAIESYGTKHCYDIPEEAWDNPALRGLKCKHCGVSLRFNPFVG